MDKQTKIEDYFSKSSFSNKKVRKKYDDDRLKIRLLQFNLIKQKNISFEDFLEFTNVRELVQLSLSRRHPKKLNKHIKYTDDYAKQIYDSCQSDLNYLSKTKTFLNLQCKPKPWITQNDKKLISEFNIKKHIKIDICKDNALTTKNNILDLWVEYSKHYNTNYYACAEFGIEYLNQKLKKYSLRHLEESLNKKILKLTTKQQFEQNNNNSNKVEPVLKRRPGPKSKTLKNKDVQNSDTISFFGMDQTIDLKGKTGSESKASKKENEEEKQTKAAERFQEFQEFSEKVIENESKLSNYETNINNKISDQEMLNSIVETDYLSKKIPISKVITDAVNKADFPSFESNLNSRINGKAKNNLVSKDKFGLLSETCEQAGIETEPQSDSSEIFNGNIMVKVNVSKKIPNQQMRQFLKEAKPKKKETPNLNESVITKEHNQTISNQFLYNANHDLNTGEIYLKKYHKLFTRYNVNYLSDEIKQNVISRCEKEFRKKLRETFQAERNSINESLQELTSNNYMNYSVLNKSKYKTSTETKSKKRINTTKANLNESAEEVCSNFENKSCVENSKLIDSKISEKNEYLSKNLTEEDLGNNECLSKNLTEEDLVYCNKFFQSSSNKFHELSEKSGTADLPMFTNNKDNLISNLTCETIREQIKDVTNCSDIENYSSILSPKKVQQIQIEPKSAMCFEKVRDSDKNLLKKLNNLNDRDGNKSFDVAEISIKKEHDTQYSNYMDEVSILPSEKNETIIIENETEDVNKIIEEMMSLNKSDTKINSLNSKFNSPEKTTKTIQNLFDNKSYSANTEDDFNINRINKQNELSISPGFGKSNKVSEIASPITISTKRLKDRKQLVKRMMQNALTNESDSLKLQANIENSSNSRNVNSFFIKTNEQKPAKPANLSHSYEKNPKNAELQCETQFSEITKVLNTKDSLLSTYKNDDDKSTLNFEQLFVVDDILQNNDNLVEEVSPFVQRPLFSEIPSSKSNDEGPKNKFVESALNKDFQNVNSKVTNSKKKNVIKFGGHAFNFTDKLQEIIKKRSILCSNVMDDPIVSPALSKRYKKQLAKQIVHKSVSTVNNNLLTTSSNFHDQFSTQSIDLFHSNSENSKISVKPELDCETQLPELSTEYNVDPLKLTSKNNDINSNEEKVKNFNFEEYFVVDKESQDHDNCTQDTSYFIQKFLPVMLQKSKDADIIHCENSSKEAKPINEIPKLSLNKNLRNMKSKIPNKTIKKKTEDNLTKIFKKRNISKKKLLSVKQSKNYNSQNKRNVHYKLNPNESFALQERHMFPSLQIIVNRGDGVRKVIEGQNFASSQSDDILKASNENHTFVQSKDSSNAIDRHSK